MSSARDPWLTTDRGFVLAGTLHRGERVVREDGTPAAVVAVAVHLGAADYYNLTVSVLHTYTVGAGQYVVHNCGSMRDLKSIGFTQDSISSVHPDGNTVEGNIQWLTDDPCQDLPPIQIFQKTSATDGIRNASNLLNGEWYSLDNRRLYAYQQTRRALIPIVEISESDAAMSSWKWTTDTWGIDIRVR